MTPDRVEQSLFVPGETVLHREAVAAADAQDPAAAAGAVDSAGRERVRFDLDTTGSTGLSALVVQALFWNPVAGRYFRGAEREFAAGELAANPVPCLDIETRGAPAVFLKIRSATATALDVDVYATPW